MGMMFDAICLETEKSEKEKFIVRNVWPFRAYFKGYHRLHNKIESIVGKGDNVLEVGIGTFKGFKKYSSKVGAKGLFVGLDEDEKTIARLNKWKEKNKRKEEFKIGDAHKLPFRTNNFDLVLINSFTGGIDRAIREAHRVLKLHGVLCVGWIFNPLQLRQLGRTLIPEFLEDFENFLIKNGFKDIANVKFAGYQGDLIILILARKK